MKWNIEQRKSPRMHLRKIYLKKLNINYQCNIGIEIFLGGLSRMACRILVPQLGTEATVNDKVLTIRPPGNSL